MNKMKFLSVVMILFMIMNFSCNYKTHRFPLMKDIRDDSPYRKVSIKLPNKIKIKSEKYTVNNAFIEFESGEIVYLYYLEESVTYKKQLGLTYQDFFHTLDEYSFELGYFNEDKLQFEFYTLPTILIYKNRRYGIIEDKRGISFYFNVKQEEVGKFDEILENIKIK